MADMYIPVTFVIQTYQRSLHSKPFVPSTTLGRAPLGANGVANKLVIASLFSDPYVGVHSAPATRSDILHSDQKPCVAEGDSPINPRRYYFKVIAIVHPLLLAELSLIGNRNEWSNYVFKKRSEHEARQHMKAFLYPYNCHTSPPSQSCPYITHRPSPYFNSIHAQRMYASLATYMHSHVHIVCNSHIILQMLRGNKCSKEICKAK